MENNRKLKLSIYDYAGNEVCPIYDSETQLMGQAANVINKSERNGWREFSFTLPGKGFRSEYVKADYKLRADDKDGTEWYIITQPKVIHNGKKKTIQVTAGHVCQLLKTKNMALEFSDNEGNNVGTCEQLLETALEGTGWEVGDVADFKEKDGQTTKVRSLNAPPKTGAFKLVNMICELFEAKPIYRSHVERTENGETTIHKVVDVKPMNPFSEAKDAIYEKIQTYADGEVLELHYGKNISNVTRTLKTDNLTTCLYAYGAYGDDVSGYCGINECKHTEFEFVLTEKLDEGTTYYFTVEDDAGVEISRNFTPTQDVAAGTKLIWSFLDRASMSYIWDESTADTQDAIHAYRISEGAKGSELPAEITVKRNEVDNVFSFLMDYSYYVDCGLFTDEMVNKLSWFQRKAVDYLNTINEKSAAYTNDWLKLSETIGDINFVKLKYTSVTNDSGSIKLNLDEDLVYYRTDYKEKRHFKWRVATSIKDNGDALNSEAAIVYVLHDTTPLTYDRFYLKKVNGETDPVTIGAIQEEDIEDITLWGSYGKYQSGDEFYLFETNGINGLLGAYESAYEALRESLDSSTKEVTMQHPVFFSKTEPVVDENVNVPSTKLDIYYPEWASFDRQYAWWYKYEDTSSPGELYFCYWADGDRAWKRVYMDTTEPSSGVTNGQYYFNWRTSKLYRRVSGNWEHLDKDDDEAVAALFGTVYAGCLTRDKYFIGQYQTYTYEQNESIEGGNYYLPNEFMGYFLFTLGVESKKLVYDTTTGFMTVYPTDTAASENTIEVKNARFDNVFRHKENIFDSSSIERGNIDPESGGDIEGEGYRTNYVPVFSNLTYRFGNFSSPFTVYYYTLKRKFISKQNVTPESSTTTVDFPNNARYIRVYSANDLADMTAQYIHWDTAIMLGEETYRLLGTPVGSGELKGINPLIEKFRAYADVTYLEDIAALESAQAAYKEQELEFKTAIGDMYREGQMQDSKYVNGDEEKLYSDALDTLKEIAKPEATYTINFIDRHCVDEEAYGEDLVRWPDFDTCTAAHLVDPEIGVNCWAYIDSVSKCYDNPKNTNITINTNMSTAAQHSFSDVLTNIANVSTRMKAKDTVYDRAANITETGKWTAEKLEGTIDANKLTITGGSSTWYTNKDGNMVFEAADGSGAMMISGNGFAIANARDKYGEWIWRSFGGGDGFSADELTTGFLSANRIAAGSITTNHISSDFGEALDISSNRGVKIIVGDLETGIDMNTESISSIVTDVNGVRNQLTQTSDKLSLMISGDSQSELSMTEDALKYISKNIDFELNDGLSIVLEQLDDFVGSLKRWITFKADEGLRQGKEGSEYSTLIDDKGYHIDKAGMLEGEHVGSFTATGLSTSGVTIGNITCRATRTGGWVWTKQ